MGAGREADCIRDDEEAVGANLSDDGVAAAGLLMTGLFRCCWSFVFLFFFSRFFDFFRSNDFFSKSSSESEEFIGPLFNVVRTKEVDEDRVCLY